MLIISEIGEHYKIISFEKNENPQNIMVVYTKLDRNCKFIKQNGKPLVDFYWLMDGKKYKPTHALIKDAVRKRLEVSSAGDTEFQLKVNDLKELNTNIEHPYMTVKVEKIGLECKVASYFPDEEKAGNLILVSSIYSESKKTFIPPFRKLMALTFRGTAPESGQAVQRKYRAR